MYEGTIIAIATKKRIMTNYFYPICIFYRNFERKKVELWKPSHRLESTHGMKAFSFLPRKGKSSGSFWTLLMDANRKPNSN